MGQAAVWSIAVAFILLGILNLAMPQGAAGVNWIISGVVALLVGWFGGRSSK